MPIYEFLCPQNHRFEKLSPLRASHATILCPSCGLAARRLVSAPSLNKIDPKRKKLVEQTESTAEHPKEVTSTPNGRSHHPTPVTHNPTHSKLPRS
jgi:putative FmdB family regulatory protein